MTQQPVYPGQQPGYPQQYPPQQGFPAQPGYPAQPPVQQQPYAPPVQGGYPGQPAPYQQPQQPAVPLAEGSIDAFYSQPSAASGPSLSWSKDSQQKPLGTTYQVQVVRDITNSDIQQETDQRSNQPKFFRDGRPKFVMKVPVKVLGSNYQTPTGQPEFPDGEATWWVKGQARDELNRAMAEAGESGAPKGGAILTITLVNRKASGAGMNPSNVVQVTYQPGNGGGASPAPVQQAAPQVQQQAPAPQPAAPQQAAPPQWAQPQVTGVVPQADPQQIPAPQAVQQAVPQQPTSPQPPAGMTPEAQAILAGLTGQQG